MIKLHIEGIEHDGEKSSFITVACSYESDIFIVQEEHRLNGKSIMNIPVINKATELSFEINGADEEKASEAIINYFTK